MNVLTRHVAVAGILVSAALGPLSWAESSAAPGTQPRTETFDPLFQLGRITGTCMIKKPGVPDFEVGVEGRAYPFGSIVQTQAESESFVYLSPSVQVGVGASSSVTFGNDANDATGIRKEVVLDEGMLALYLPNDNDTDFPLAIRTAVARFDNFKGRSKLKLVKTAEGHQLTLVTAMGDLRVKGPQFSIEKMRRSSSIDIMTAFDESFTSLTGKSGDFEVTIERGIDEPVVTGFRAGARAKIWRRRAALSDRLAVSVMIAGAEGGVQTSFAYLQGESAVAGAMPQTQDEPSTQAVDSATAALVPAADPFLAPAAAPPAADPSPTPSATPTDGAKDPATTTPAPELWNF